MEPEAKFEYYQDILKHIYKNNIDVAADLLTHLPFRPIIPEANLVESALLELQYRRYDRAAYAVQHLVAVFAPDDMATAVLDEGLEELKSSQPDSIVIKQIEAHRRSKEPTVEEQTHFPDLAKYSPAINLTRLLVLFLVLGILIQFIGLKFDRDERVLLNRMQDGQFVSNASLLESDDQQQVIGYVFLASTVAWFILLLLWMRRRYLNLIAFGAAGLQYSSRMAWSGFYKPFLNLLIPHNVAQEIWRASDPKVNSGFASQWNDLPENGFILIWWLSFLPFIIFGTITSPFENLIQDTDAVEQLVTTNSYSQLGRVLLVTQYTLTIVFVVKVAIRQNMKVRAL